MKARASALRHLDLSPFWRSLKGHDSKVAALIGEEVKKFNDFIIQLPVSHTWTYTTATAFQTLACLSPNDGDKLFWGDVLEQLEAFRVLSAWRALNLAKLTVKLLNKREFLGSATLARALMETAASQYHFAFQFKRVAEAAISGSGNLQEVEELLLRVLFASKEESEIYKPTNIITKIKFASEKTDNDSEAFVLYGKLCEVTHPNKNGLMMFLADLKQTNIEGRNFRKIDGSFGPTGVLKAVDAALSLAWSVSCSCDADAVLLNLRSMIEEKLRATAQPPPCKKNLDTKSL